jgi:hypothetical protein
MIDLYEIFKEQAEKDRKAIPSKVFFNHFHAINYRIVNDDTRFQLKKIDFFNKIKIKNPDFDLDICRKLLWNSWSTEYAFLMTSNSENSDYYRFALHWHFPQIYYSIYLSMTAFHETQGIANDQHEKSIKLFGNSVKDGHYPDAIQYYSQGGYKDFKYHGLKTFTGFPKEFSALTKVTNITDAELHIANFLKSTREQNAENKKKRGEKSFAKDPRFLTRSGSLTKKFSEKHWNYIYSSIPETTLLNMMYRLRIKANYHDIETFMNAEIDFKLFHEYLGNILHYLNFVHEAYVHKAIGDDSYQKILNDFKGHILETRAKSRYNDLIVNI